MATKAARGTKRTCQSSSCGSRFYDLGRDPIVCPMCDTEYVVAMGGPSAVAAAAAAAAARKPAPEFDTADDKAADAPADAEAELAEIEGGDEPVAVADDETFLEEEEDGGTDIGIVGGGEEPEEQ